MERAKIYNTVWRGIDYWITEFYMRDNNFERVRRDSGMDRYIALYGGGRDAYREINDFLLHKVIGLPYPQHAQMIENYCNGLCTNPDVCDGYYEKGKAQENKKIVDSLRPEIAALRERFGEGENS